MSLQLTILAAAQGGVFTRAQAIACGLSSDEVKRLVSSGDWHRIRRGAYVTAQTWDESGLAERHVFGLRALVLLADPPVVGSHETAAAVLSLELWEPSYEWINLTRPAHSARREAGVWHHKLTLPTSDIVISSGLLVTSPLRTGLDIARTVEFEHAVVALDSALRLSGAPIEQLLAMHATTADWPGGVGAGRAVAFADCRSGSVGESRGRVHLAAIEIAELLTQVSIYDEFERLLAITDFLADGKTIIEFDGLVVKYSLDGLDPEAMARRLSREKEREDALRRLGYEVVRIVWADFYRPGRIVSMVRAAMARAEASPPVRGRFAVEPLPSPRAA